MAAAVTSSNNKHGVGANFPKLTWMARLLAAVYGFGLDCARIFKGILNPFLNILSDLISLPNSTNKANVGFVVTSSDFTIDRSSSRHLWFRLYNPAATTTTSKQQQLLPLIVYFHGGGFQFFSPNSKPYNDFCLRIAAEIQAVVVSVNYRLAPKHRFPSQYDDGFDTLKFIDSSLSDVVLPPTVNRGRCFIAGDSAGGNIAHHVTVRASNEAAAGGFERLNVIGLISLQAYFGGEERTESELRLTRVPIVDVPRTDWLWKTFLPKGSDRNHWAAHVMGPPEISSSSSSYGGGGMKNFPAAMVVVGGWDPLKDWQRRYYQWLKINHDNSSRRSSSCGGGKDVDDDDDDVVLVEYPDAVHFFYGFPGFVAETDMLLKSMANFVNKQSANLICC